MNRGLLAARNCPWFRRQSSHRRGSDHRLSGHGGTIARHRQQGRWKRRLATRSKERFRRWRQSDEAMASGAVQVGEVGSRHRCTVSAVSFLELFWILDDVATPGAGRQEAPASRKWPTVKRIAMPFNSDALPPWWRWIRRRSIG